MIGREYFGEGKNIEFKREIPKNHEKFLKDIIAFSNCSGGKVIIGIVDDMGAVVGIGEQSPFRLSDKISNMIADACEPQIEPDISVQSLNGQTILVVDIVPGKFRPYYLKSRGKDVSAYIRVNGTSRPADKRKLQEMELEGQRISYDSIQEIGQDYDEARALELCRDMKDEALASCQMETERADVKNMTISKLEDFRVLCRVGRELCPTHAFMLLTENRLRCAKIQCARFKGKTRSFFIDKREYGGPIHKQVEEAYRFVLKHINLGADIEGIHTREIYELPQWAIREMIANAVVHRSYLIESCIQVSVYDDRVEVDSPGMLYDGLNLEEAKLGTSRCRNAAIAESFHYMRIIDAWGTRIPRIIETCRAYGLRDPMFEEFGVGFKVTMFRKVHSANRIADIKFPKMNSTSQNVNSASQNVNSTSQNVNSASQNVNSASQNVNSTSQNVNSASQNVNSASQNVNSSSQNMDSGFERYQEKLRKAGITKIFIENIQIIYEKSELGVAFRQADIMNWLQCSQTKAANVIKAMKKAEIIENAEGMGFGRYFFVN